MTPLNLPKLTGQERCWTLRICRECGDRHGSWHDGCVTYSHPMFPQETEYAGVDEVKVIPAEVTDEMVERARAWERRSVGPHTTTHLPEWWREALTAALSTKVRRV